MRQVKNYYYVQVIVGNKIKFVTSVDNAKQVTYWEDDKEFKVFESKSYASDIANGLCFNGYYAFVVESLYKLDFTNDKLK